MSANPNLPVSVEARRAVRGVDLIEYALLAAVLVALVFIFRSQIGNILNTLYGRIRSSINTG